MPETKQLEGGYDRWASGARECLTYSSLEAAFTTAELRKLKSTHDCDLSLSQSIGIDVPAIESRARRRLLELMQSLPLRSRHKTQAGRSVCLQFNTKPVAIRKSDRGLVVSLCTQDTSTVDKHVDLVVHCIGYHGYNLEPELIPFSDEAGVIANTAGRVSTPQSTGKLYCAGWIKRGSKGTVADLLHDACETVDSIMSDHSPASATCEPTRPKIEKWLRQATPESSHRRRVTTIADWFRLDELEKEKGKILGKEREKISNFDDFL